MMSLLALGGVVIASSLIFWWTERSDRLRRAADEQAIREELNACARERELITKEWDRRYRAAWPTRIDRLRNIQRSDLK